MDKSILEILKSTDINIDWQCDYLNFIWNEVRKIDSDKNITHSEKLDLYFKKVIKKHWEVFKRVTDYCIKDGELPDFDKEPYQIGIYLVGFSEIPLILSIERIKPREKIYFLYSIDSKESIENIEETISKNINDSSEIFKTVKDFFKRKEEKIELKEVENISDPAEVFKIIKEIINDNKDKKIALDITGGKKPMISGAFSSASLTKNCDMFYVDSEKYNPDERKPEAGTEFLAKLPNPNEIYRVEDLIQAKELFNNYQFSAVKSITARMINAMKLYDKVYDLKKETKEVEKLQKWANVYENWEQYKYKSAIDCLEISERSENMEKLAKINKWIDEECANLGKTEPSTKVYKNVQIRIFNDNELSKLYSIDKYLNAVRRRNNDEQGTAIRLSNILEFISYYLLYCNMNQISANPPTNSIDLFEDLQSVYNRFQLLNGNNFKINRQVNYNFNLDLSYIKRNYDTIQKIISLRNSLSIVHSIATVDVNALDNYMETVKEIIKSVWSLDETGFKNIKEDLEFKKADEILAGESKVATSNIAP